MSRLTSCTASTPQSEEYLPPALGQCRPGTLAGAQQTAAFGQARHPPVTGEALSRPRVFSRPVRCLRRWLIYTTNVREAPGPSCPAAGRCNCNGNYYARRRHRHSHACNHPQCQEPPRALKPLTARPCLLFSAGAGHSPCEAPGPSWPAAGRCSCSCCASRRHSSHNRWRPACNRQSQELS